MRTNPASATAAVLLCAAISSSALAGAPEKSNAVTYGAGGDSCGTWLATRNAKDTGGMLTSSLYNQWLLGWVSAAGYYGEALGKPLGKPMRLRTTDGAALFAWVDNYCREHPLDPIALAAARLVATLAKAN